MSRTWKSAPFVILMLLVTGLAAWAVYAAFIGGTTSGPDFIRAIKSGSISPGLISSIEVVEPAVGHIPFTSSEYDGLPRRKTINDVASIRRLLTLLKNSQPGRIYQNHPAAGYQVYLKANCQDGFFWLYGDVRQDDHGAVLDLSANTRNAVNPNGASTYHLDDFAEILVLLQHDKNTEQNGATSGSQSVSSLTNSTPSVAGFHR